MKLIPLTQGKFAQVDDEWYDYLMQWKWHAVYDKKNYYAGRTINTDAGRRTMFMHTVIVYYNPDMLKIDHMDGDGLNDQYGNLRLCTNMQNCRGQKKRKRKCYSIYKGVTWSIRDEVWMSYIYVCGRRKHLGYFDNPIDAAKLYDNYSIENFGEFARLNFPENKTVK